MPIRTAAASALCAATLSLSLLAAKTSRAAEPLKIELPANVSHSRLRFCVVDATTHLPVANALVRIEDAHLSTTHLPYLLAATSSTTATTAAFDAANWTTAPAPLVPLAPNEEWPDSRDEIITVPVGATVVLQQAGGKPAKSGQAGPPVLDVYLKVTATRPAHPKIAQTAGGTTVSNTQLNTFVNKAANNATALTQGQSGVASDSNGQQHIRGEHADISFVVDGVVLPDTLSGRQGSVVVPSTIESLDIVTGGFAPEFGGQTAAVLNITTLPNATTMENTLTLQGGSYGTANTDFTSSGPLGKKASYVVNISADRTNNGLEPQQPDNQTAHNGSNDQSYFAKLRFAPTAKDGFTLTVSHAPSNMEISNRAGLPSKFAAAGQGYGFLGQRDADGNIAPLAPQTESALGSATMVLPSQQAEGMDIAQNELNEFATLTWRHQLKTADYAQLSGVILHSSQGVHNSNPAVDLNDLPVDNSIEYNPTASRSVHHYQLNGDVTVQRPQHQLKIGFLSDQEVGDESYNIVPASQLALNELAALSPNLAPTGTISSTVDVYGNPIYTPAAGAVSPTLTVHRSGFYDGAYIQDTWKVTRQFEANYGLRYDRYRQGQNLGQPIIDKFEFSPRVNLSYALSKATQFRTSWDHLFNIPPLAQGAVVGEPIQPEILDQYDASLEHRIAPGQSAKVAYYYKQIHDQVDTGLLIPGSEIGLYSAVNFQYGGVHGIETSYDFSPPSGVGLDGYLNYTYSIAEPNGLDNTGAPAPQYNDHDQRHTVGAGLAYLFKGGATTAVTLNYGSGLASSIVPPSSDRTPRTSVDLRAATGSKVLYGHGGFGLDITNLFDDRSVINYLSGFSGTRFVEGRRILVSTFVSF